MLDFIGVIAIVLTAAIWIIWLVEKFKNNYYKAGKPGLNPETD